MGDDSNETANESDGRRRCGYEYMTPTYVQDENIDDTVSYPVIANALLENSSAHGLPTLYRAQGHSNLAVTTMCWTFQTTCFDTHLFSRIAKIQFKNNVFIENCANCKQLFSVDNTGNMGHLGQ